MNLSQSAFSVIVLLFVAFSSTEQSFISESLKLHNAYRARHGLPALQYNKNIEKVAQDWANLLARENRGLRHRPNNKYGENLYAIFGRAVKPQDAMQAWYNEGRNYNYNAEPSNLSAGHFTQMVWKGSREVGIGVARNGNNYYVAMNYSPHGNVIGQFRKNVPRPK